MTDPSRATLIRAGKWTLAASPDSHDPSLHHWVARGASWERTRIVAYLRELGSHKEALAIELEEHWEEPGE